MLIDDVDIPAELTENSAIVALMKTWRGLLPGLYAISYLKAALRPGGYLARPDTIKEVAMDNLKPHWMCGCLHTDHPRWECPKMTQDERDAHKARVLSYTQMYTTHPLLQQFFDNAKGKESAVDDKTNNAHVSEVAHWPDLYPELKLYPMPTPRERTVFSWSVPHDRTTFNTEYLGQPDGSLRQVPKILVTPEMRMNGGSVLRGGRAGTGRLNPEDDAQAIYRAMHAVAPVPLVSEADDRIAQLRADRDNALDLAIAETEKYNKACDQIAILRQRLALHGESVTFPADPPPTHTTGDLKPEPTREPKPIPTGALQPTPTDRRRIGG